MLGRSGFEVAKGEIKGDLMTQDTHNPGRSVTL